MAAESADKFKHFTLDEPMSSQKTVTGLIVSSFILILYLKTSLKGLDFLMPEVNVFDL